MKLKPCPFCGGKVELEEDFRGMKFIACNGYKCPQHVDHPSWDIDTKDVIKAWNKRS
jgi:Lar family restriction alleviation protein